MSDKHIVKLQVGVNGEPVTVNMIDGTITFDNHNITLSRRAVTDIFIGLKRMYTSDVLKSTYFGYSPDEEFKDYMVKWLDDKPWSGISIPIVSSIRKLHVKWSVEDVIGRSDEPEVSDGGLLWDEQPPDDEYDGPRYFEDTEPQGGA